MEQIILSNKIRLLFQPMPNTHSVTCGLYIRAGSAFESDEESGITHFLEHLQFRRLGDWNQKEIYYRMESIGASLHGATYRDFMEFSLKTVPEELEKAMQILSRVLSCCEWTEEEFEKERQVVLNQIYEKGDWIYGEDLMYQCVFRNTAFAKRIIGTAENIRRFSMDDIRKTRDGIYKRDNLIFCITGCIDDDMLNNAVGILEKLNIPEGSMGPVLPVPPGFARRKPDIVFHSAADDLLDVYLSFDVTEKEQEGMALTLLNSILGEGVGSRLQEILREEAGYTADISSYIERHSGFSVLHIHYYIEKHLLQESMKKIAKVLRSLKKNIQKRDLDISLPFHTKNRVFLEDDTDAMNFEIGFRYIVEGKESAEIIPALIKSETIEKLQVLAGKVFRPERASLAVAGNTNRITKKALKQIVAELDD